MSPSGTMIRGGQQQDTSIQRPTGKEVLGLPVAKSTEPPHPVLQPHRWGQHSENQLLEAAHQLFPLQYASQSPLLLIHLGNCTEKGRRKQIMVPVTAALFLPGCPSLPLETLIWR